MEKNEIQVAANEALKVISSAAAEAAKVIANASAEALKVSQLQNTKDHDLLVEMKTKMERISQDISDMSKRDGNFVMKDDFVFWRNILVGSMLTTVFVSVLINVISK